MNDKQLDSITDEILDCFTCDEEMMSEEGVLRRRIREVLGDKLIEKQNKNKVEPPNICPSEERGSFNAIENITGAISGQWATYALCAESVTRLKKKYKGSEWTIVNYSVNPYDKNFVQDEEMEIKLMSIYGLPNIAPPTVPINPESFKFEDLFNNLKLKDDCNKSVFVKTIVDRELKKFNVITTYLISGTAKIINVHQLEIKGDKGAIIISLNNEPNNCRYLNISLYINTVSLPCDRTTCRNKEYFNLTIRNWLEQIN